MIEISFCSDFDSFFQPGSWRKVLKKKEEWQKKGKEKGQKKGQEKRLQKGTMAGRRLFTRKSKVSTDF